MKFLRPIPAFLAALFIITSPALAGTVDLSPVYAQLNELLAAVFTALVAWAVSYFVAWLKAHAKFLSAQTQAQLGTIVDDALKSGVAYAMAQATDAEKAHPTATVDGFIATMGAKYAIAHIPDTLAKMGITPDQVPHLILARLPAPPVSAVAVK